MTCMAADTVLNLHTSPFPHLPTKDRMSTQVCGLGTADSTNTPQSWLFHDQRQRNDHTAHIITGKRGIMDVCSPGRGECKHLSDGSECRTEGWEAQDRVY